MRKIARMISAAFMAVILFVGAGATQTSAAVTFPVIKQGSTGANAVATQYLLKLQGYNISADGKIGSASVAAIQSFQSSIGLKTDGIAGTNTFNALVVTARYGNDNYAVTALQYLLRNKFGAAINVDGKFGTTTLLAVKSFQSQMGISSDGIVGKTTWRYLLGSGTASVGQSSGSSSSGNASDIAIDKAKSILGSTAYDGLCQRFVRISYEASGIQGFASTALEAWNKWGVSSSSSNIPKGAIVYFETSSSGHAGIYMGDGNVIHAVETVRIESLSALMAKYKYIGWGYQGGVNPNS